MGIVKRILLVEDEPILLELYTTILTDEGFTVSQATNGVDGLHAIKEDKYDLVLLDTMMPRMDGLQVLETLSKTNGMKDMKQKRIVMLSNLDQDGTIRRALELGACGYMVKSDYTPDQIVDRINYFLRTN